MCSQYKSAQLRHDLTIHLGVEPLAVLFKMAMSSGCLGASFRRHEDLDAGDDVRPGNISNAWFIWPHSALGMVLRILLLGILIAPGFLCAKVPPPEVLSPDVFVTSLDETICVSGYTRTVRPSVVYTNGVKRRLMREQGLAYEAHHSEYELDHIIPLALGGHPRNLGNLMLQPWVGENSAKRKDRLEVKLQCLVCSGQISLGEAQSAIWTDWRDAYSRYSPMACHRKKSLKASDYGD